MPEWRHQVIGFGSGEGLEVQGTVAAPARNPDGLIQRLARRIGGAFATDEIAARSMSSAVGGLVGLRLSLPR
jgi:hypothetical protein